MSREEYLYRKLESGNLSPEEEAAIEAELDRIAAAKTNAQLASKNRKEQEAIKQAEQREQAKIAKIDAAMRNIAVKVAGDNHELWTAKTSMLYRIDDDFTVHSEARGPDNLNQWKCPSLYEAKKKVLALVRWKFRDHFERGNDFMYDPAPDLTQEEVEDLCLARLI